MVQITIAATAKTSLGNDHKGVNNHEVGAVTSTLGVTVNSQTKPTTKELLKQSH